MVITNERFYKVRQLAKRWGVSDQHIWNLLYAGDLACYRIGRAVRISESAADAYLKSRRSGGDDADDSANTD